MVERRGEGISVRTVGERERRRKGIIVLGIRLAVSDRFVQNEGDITYKLYKF